MIIIRKHIYKMTLNEVFPHSDILKLAISQALNSDTPYREHEFLITTLKHQSYSVMGLYCPYCNMLISYHSNLLQNSMKS